MNIFPQLPKLLPIGTIIKVIKYAWSVITGNDKKQEEISSKKGFNPEKSDANEIAELNKLLTEYRKNIIAAGSEIEREMIAECVLQLQDIMDVFDKFNKDLKIARSDSIKRKFHRLSNDLKGTFTEYIERKISLDNYDCIKILKLPAGELKNQRLQEMKQNIFIEAKDAMVDKIKYTVSDFSEIVEDAFLEHLDRVEQSVEEKTNAFEKLSSAANNDTESVESVLLQSNYILAVCTYVETL